MRTERYDNKDPVAPRTAVLGVNLPSSTRESSAETRVSDREPFWIPGYVCNMWPIPGGHSSSVPLERVGRHPRSRPF